jgi:predicted MFS family arabinose efflux permease
MRSCALSADIPRVSRMTRPLMALFAVAGGAAVGSLYYAQPLLTVIARDLRVSESVVGLLVTATQIGYALGILFIVPLGDFRDRRRLIPLMMLLSAAVLAACAAAPGIVTLAIALAAVGVTTVAGQLLTPLAGDLTEPASRGRVVGVVVSGLVTGILVARIFSGLIADTGGWRIVFLVGAVVAVVLACALYRSIPRLEPKTPMASYGALLRSVASLVARERTLQVSMAFGVIGFGAFTMFWTALTFLLSSPPYNYSTSTIGLFGIAGLVGALASQGAGRVHDRGWSVRGAGAAWLLILIAWTTSGLAGHRLVPLLAGIVVLDIGIQGQNILNQSRIFGISAEARSRLNTAYISGNFIGGAIGSLGATVLWSMGGWEAVCAGGASGAVVSLVLWLATRNGTLRAAAAAG